MDLEYHWYDDDLKSAWTVNEPVVCILGVLHSKVN